MNKKIEPRILKGFRDFLPEEERKRQYVINTLKKVFESYGFEPLETPALEYEEILLGKYGEEGDKLMYKFEDLGGRKVALRYDQTVPLARVVAQYQNELPMPFKRYQIQPVWRAENTQKGRFREFMQCDIDTVGSFSSISDAEIILCTLKAFKELKFKDAQIWINDRTIFDNLGLTRKEIIILDKQEKIGRESVINLLKEAGKEDAESTLKSLDNSSPTERLNEIFNILEKEGYGNKKDFSFVPNLARGLEYYTSTIFEIKTGNYLSSLAGGGRYDNLIGMFLKMNIPAVGISFGFDRIIEAMDQMDLFPQEVKNAVAKVLVTVFNKDLLDKSVDVSSQLRSNNINAELYLDENVKMEKQIKYADKRMIPFVVIIGPDEAKENKVTVKNLKTGEQETVEKDQLVSLLLEKK